MVEISKKKEKAVIEISSRLCTGCTICVEVCPTDVLAMEDDASKTSGQIAKVANLPACTKCMLCEIECPDFAITVK